MSTYDHISFVVPLHKCGRKNVRCAIYMAKEDGIDDLGDCLLRHIIKRVLPYVSSA